MPEPKAAERMPVVSLFAPMEDTEGSFTGTIREWLAAQGSELPETGPAQLGLRPRTGQKEQNLEGGAHY